MHHNQRNHRPSLTAFPSWLSQQRQPRRHGSRHFVGRGIVSFLLALTGLIPAVAAGQTIAHKVFPKETKGFLCISSAETLAEQWEKTQIGQLMQDPVMEPFWQDLREQLQQRWTGQFGLTIEDFQKISGGEVGAGLIAIAGQKPGVAVTVDITGHLPATEEFLGKLEKDFLAQNARKNTINLSGAVATSFTFAATETFPEERRVIYFITSDILVVTDQVYLAELLLQRIGGTRTSPLSENAAYQSVMDRCQADSSTDQTPLIRWFLEPLPYLKAVRAMRPAPVDAKQDALAKLDILAEQGFDGIEGIGGHVEMATEKNFEFLHRTYLYAPAPREKSLQMLRFLNEEDYEVPAWVPRDLARYSSFHVDPIAVFDHFGPLFDAMVGESGVWKDIVAGLETDPYGPQIDLREELITQLGDRVITFSHYDRPITPQSENLLVAAEIKPGTAATVTQALEKMLGNDPGVIRREYRGHLIWQNSPETATAAPGNESPLDFPTDSQLGEGEEQPDPLFPTGAATIAGGYVLLANKIDYLSEIIDAMEATETSNASLQESIDYHIIESVTDPFGGEGPHFLETFARSDESLRPVYELFRQGKMPQAKTLFGRFLNSIFAQEGELSEAAGREPEINATKMPEFEVVRRHFGPAGMIGIAEDDGWFFKGVMVPK